MSANSGSTPGSEPFAHLLRYGLARAIQAHSDELRARHPQAALDLDLVDDEGLMEWAAYHALYRVYLEAMANILRDEDALQSRPVRVHYAPIGNTMCLEIRSSEQAFSIVDDWSRFQRGGLGVMGMKAQLEGMGGALKIASEPGEDTAISASLPLTTTRAE